MFAAIRRASSFASSLAADPPVSHKPKSRRNSSESRRFCSSISCLVRCRGMRCFSHCPALNFATASRRFTASIVAYSQTSALCSSLLSIYSFAAFGVQRTRAAGGHGTLSLFDDCVSNLTPSSPRNSIPCSSKTRRIVSRVHARIGGVPLTCSPREIADSETLLWSDNLRIGHFSNARAARICAPLIGTVEVLSDLLSTTRVHSPAANCR